MAQKRQTDIVIIGGGASGLAAAVAAKRIAPNLQVCIVERNSRVGKKILATGNGRCNLGNTNLSLMPYHGTLTELLPEVFAATLDAEAFLQSMGLYCRHEADGRLYPHSNQAASVLDALRLTAEQMQIEMLCDCAVLSLSKNAEQFAVETAHGKIEAKAVILAAGGMAAPKTGSDGMVFSWLRELGHGMPTLQPALVAFATDPELVRPLKGIRIAAKVSAWSGTGKLLGEEPGEVQFTERALSGICVMNLSAQCTVENPAVLSLNLLPEYSQEQVISLLWEIYAVRTEWTLENWLTGLFPKKIGVQLLRASHISLPLDAPVYRVTPQELEQLAVQCQAWRFPVLSRGSWQEAQVTAGGIPLAEVDPMLQSKMTGGLYFAGEILDLHGDCGGYNLNLAWRSGQFAGQNAARALMERDQEGV